MRSDALKNVEVGLGETTGFLVQHLGDTDHFILGGDDRRAEDGFGLEPGFPVHRRVEPFILVGVFDDLADA